MQVHQLARAVEDYDLQQCSWGRGVHAAGSKSKKQAVLIQSTLMSAHEGWTLIE